MLDNPGGHCNHRPLLEGWRGRTRGGSLKRTRSADFEDGGKEWKVKK